MLRLRCQSRVKNFYFILTTRRKRGTPNETNYQNLINTIPRQCPRCVDNKFNTCFGWGQLKYLRRWLSMMNAPCHKSIYSAFAIGLCWSRKLIFRCSKFRCCFCSLLMNYCRLPFWGRHKDPARPGAYLKHLILHRLDFAVIWVVIRIVWIIKNLPNWLFFALEIRNTRFVR